MANNPYKNKVIFDGNTLIDLTGDNVDPNRMLVNTTAHDASGAPITGNIAVRYSSDMYQAADFIYAAAGYYPTDTSKHIASGTAGTPTASKGTVINHSVDVTPSVTNTAGYINGGTINGYAATVTAAELVSGTKSITENGTGIDVTNYASVDVNVVQKRTATITRTGMYDVRGDLYSAVRYPNYTTVYYTQGDTFEFTPNTTMNIRVGLYSSGNITITVDGLVVDSTTSLSRSYDYTLPDSDIEIALDSSINKNDIEITTVGSGSITVNPLSITQNGTYTAPTGTAYSPVTVNVQGSSPNLQAKTNIAPTTSSQTITADAGYDGLSSVQINAMPSGTAGTPTATKGAVSNHAVTVTPSVTNSTGYINGGTKTGTGVTVTASELVSGSQTITQNGTVNVTNLASVDVQIPFVTYYTGTTDPPASLGSNGDIYLKVVS